MKTTVDQRILSVAARSGGVCTRAQLEQLGVSAGAIAVRLDAGHLESVARGVYVVAALHGERTPLFVAKVAVPIGALSHRTALRLQGADDAGASLHLLVPKDSNHRLDPFTVHETRLWFDDDITRIDGLRVTKPARTLCDLASLSRPVRLRHITQTHLTARRLTTDELVACHQRLTRRGRRGTRRMRQLLSELVDDQPFPMSKLEALVFDGLAARGCHGLQRQFRPPWYDGRRGIVDGADPIGRTIIEADGRAWHSTTQAAEEDRRRDRRAAAAGWVVLRVGWREVTTRPDATFGELIDVIERRRSAATDVSSA